jgi:hypothetical protein
MVSVSNHEPTLMLVSHGTFLARQPGAIGIATAGLKIHWNFHPDPIDKIIVRSKLDALARFVWAGGPNAREQ